MKTLSIFLLCLFSLNNLALSSELNGTWKFIEGSASCETGEMVNEFKSPAATKNTQLIFNENELEIRNLMEDGCTFSYLSKILIAPSNFGMMITHYKKSGDAYNCPNGIKKNGGGMNLNVDLIDYRLVASDKLELYDDLEDLTICTESNRVKLQYTRLN